MSFRFSDPLKVLACCFTIFMLVHGLRVLLIPLLPLIGIEFKLSNTSLGLLASVLAFSFGAQRLLFGFLVLKFGEKKLIMIGTFLFSMVAACMVLVNGYWQLLMVLVFLGFTLGIYPPIGTSLISKLFPKKTYGKILGIHATAPSLGMIIGLLSAPLVAEMLGWRMSYLLFALPSFLLAFSLKHLKLESANEEFSFKENFFNVLRNKKVLNLLTPFILFNLSMLGFTSMMPLYLVSARQLSVFIAASSLLICTVGGLFGPILGGSLSDKFGRTVVLLTAFISMAVLNLIFISLPFGVGMMITVFCYGLAYTAVFPLTWAYISDRIQPHLRALTIALFTTAGQIIGGISSTIVGWIADWMGFGIAFTFPALPVIGSALITAFILTREGDFKFHLSM